MMGAQEAADAGETGVVLAAAQGGNAHGFGIRAHGAELDQEEGTAALSHTFLTVEHGAAVIQLNQQGAKGDERREHHQKYERNRQVEGTLDKKVRLGKGTFPAACGLCLFADGIL